VKLTDLRGILQYIPQFREKIFILAIDAGIVVDDSLSTLLLDVALLRSLNIRWIHCAAAARETRCRRSCDGSLLQGRHATAEHVGSSRTTDRIEA